MSNDKNEIIRKLNNNEVVGFPTDTVFALIAKLEKKNITKLNKLKNRDIDQPIQILFPSLKEATISFEEDYFVMNYLSNNFKEKTSYLLKAKDAFNNKFLTGSYNREVLIRIPEGEILEIIKEVGPLFATSANIHNKEPMVDNKDIEKEFNIYVSNLKQENNNASSIISLIEEEVKEVR